MSLPFLKPKDVATTIIQRHKKDGSVESLKPGEHPAEHMAAAEELIRHIHGKDAHGVVSAIKSLFSQFDSEPHEEGEHTEEHE